MACPSPFSTHTSAYKSSDKGINWQVENTLTYDKTIGKHSFAVVLGQSAMKNKSDYLNGSRSDHREGC